MDAVLVERRGGVALITLNRPRNRNALGSELKAGLASAILGAISDEGVGCLVITGTEDAFCAGGDLTAMDDRRPDMVRKRMDGAYVWVRALLAGDKPVVAAVNGAAAGAGFALAMLCDLILMSETAYVQAGFPAIGAVPDLGLAYTLPRAIGMARARELLLTNRRVTAAEAVAMGMALRACPPADLLDAALDVAGRIAAGPRPSLALTRQLLARAYGPLEEFLAGEGMAQAVAFGSPDFADGVEAFLAKRKATFGRHR